ncbi:hypothetical protein JCM16418_2942 [Paenibacillus pini JCM 16418]|uniref:Uncharacterized protein n=1 Tax=Paenibacillus pini JCM 16418 TaxID=1236976 RepID=W7YD48_9BACL|nr:hypothetical protein JCM16418_2942 [Paenibacillus pini JCM 16418]
MIIAFSFVGRGVNGAITGISQESMDTTSRPTPILKYMDFFFGVGVVVEVVGMVIGISSFLTVMLS